MIFLKDKKEFYLFIYFIATNTDVASTPVFLVKIFNFCDVYAFLLKNVLVENLHVPSLTTNQHNKFINGTKYPFLIHKPLGYFFVCDFFPISEVTYLYTEEKNLPYRTV